MTRNFIRSTLRIATRIVEPIAFEEARHAHRHRTIRNPYRTARGRRA